jgi:glycosyltransferase involved in cell wall biosynthesis
MRIGVNTRFLLPHKMEGFGWFTYETISRIVRAHPEHDFIFFFDRPYDKEFIFAANVTPVIVRPPARHPILFKIWFDFSLPRMMKKYKCDAFISPDGYVSLKVDIPQLAVIHDLNFEHNPEDLPLPALKYLKKYFPKFAQKAGRICTVSEYSKKDIATVYKIDSEKIDVAYNGAADVFRPIDATKQQEIREQYTDGLPYILFVGALHKRKNINRLLQAFAQFKQQDEKGYQLLIVGEALWGSQHIEVPESVATNVLFTGHIRISELADITASADLLAFVSYFEGFGIPLLEAMQSGTPVLAGNRTALPEIGGDAVHYCDPFDVGDIADQLTRLLQDEKLRTEYREKGLERAKQFSWDQTANGLWSSFEKMMAK